MSLALMILGKYMPLVLVVGFGAFFVVSCVRLLPHGDALYYRVRDGCIQLIRWTIRLPIVALLALIFIACCIWSAPHAYRGWQEDRRYKAKGQPVTPHLA